jgi:hypothetical protein
MNAGFQPAAWHDLFVATATASAALLGLFFVAISLHSIHIEGHAVLRNRARNNLHGLLALLVISVAVLIPGLPLALLGVVIIVAIAIVLALGAIGTVGMMRTGVEVAPSVWRRLSFNVVLLLCAFGAGISLIIGKGPGLYLEALAILIGLPSSCYYAWLLLFAPELQKHVGLPLADRAVEVGPRAAGESAEPVHG